jgi:hypothetical protein
VLGAFAGPVTRVSGMAANQGRAPTRRTDEEKVR